MSGYHITHVFTKYFFNFFFMLAGFLFSEECKIKRINDYAKCFNNLIQIQFDPSIISDAHFGLLTYKICSDINVGF